MKTTTSMNMCNKIIMMIMMKKNKNKNKYKYKYSIIKKGSLNLIQGVMIATIDLINLIKIVKDANKQII